MNIIELWKQLTKAVDSFLDARERRPLWIFTLLPTLVLAIPYLTAWLGGRSVPYLLNTVIYCCMALGLILLLWFARFLKLRRPDEFASMGAVLPSVAGPMFTGWYVDLQVWSPSSTLSLHDLKAALDAGGQVNLHDVLEAGGGILIQMAFFFTSMAALCFYLAQRFTRGQKKDFIPFIIFVAIGAAMVLVPKDVFFFSAPVPGHDILPGLTLFLVARYLIVMSAVGLSTWPTSASITVASTAQV